MMIDGTRSRPRRSIKYWIILALAGFDILLYMLEGIDPAGVLSDISKETSCVRLATEGGNGPLKSLTLSFQNFKFISLAKKFGIWPLR